MNDVIDAIVEIPFRSRNKYETDHKTGRMRLDRVLYSAMGYPCEYGIVENTLADDGDPLDILILATEPTYPGCIVPARVVGYLTMYDGGKEDCKLISVVNSDPRFNHVNEINDIEPFTLDEIKDFFKNYKNLQDGNVEVGDYHSKAEALSLVEYCKSKYKN